MQDVIEFKEPKRCNLCGRAVRLRWTVNVVAGVFTRLESRNQEFCVKCTLQSEQLGAVVNRKPFRLIPFPCSKAA